MQGNKAKNLEVLKKAFDKSIPDFFVLHGEDYISPEVFSDVVSKLDRENIENASFELCGYLNQNYRDRVIHRLRSSLNIPWAKSAVRSSSSLEDGSAASFAGQFETFLNVEINDVPERIWDCFLSLFQENVLQYMVKNGLPWSSLSMDVIVQEMVQADQAGVLFGVNPQGILNEIVITVDEGLGENVVGGKTHPTSYYYNTTDQLYYYEGKKDLLSREQIDELISISENAKNILDIQYPDMEFAIKDNKIYILQVRPITTIKTGDENPLIFDNTNIVESYPGISLPLTCSFVNMVYGGVFRDVCTRVLKDKNIIDEVESVFYHMVGNVNGRVYYKITNWYTILLILPFSRKIIPVWQEMMGVRNKSFDKKQVKLNLIQRMANYIHVFQEFIRVPKNMDLLNEEFHSIQAYYRQTFHENMSNAELLDIFETPRKRLFSCWGVTLLNDMYAFVFTGLLKNRLIKKYGVDAENVNKLISGISNIESMKPIRALVDLCYEKDSLSEQEFRSKFEQYIEDYGDRNLEELKLESRTFRSTPSLLEDKISEYTRDKASLLKLYEKMHAGERERTEHKGWKDWLTRQWMKRCSLGIANREISRLNRSRIYGFVRSIMEEIGKNFVQAGILEDYMDIHYLTLSEVFYAAGVECPLPAHLTGQNEVEDRLLKEVVNVRKAEYEIYRQLPAFSRLVFSDKSFSKTHSCVNSKTFKQDTSVIHGTPCSSGVVTAEALVVEDVNSVKDVSGRILVTKMTDPGWVFLLTSAGGVISEKGSLLSHTSIISRELNIPSIVGVPGIINMISTGDLIRMDGNHGTVEILKRAGE